MIKLYYSMTKPGIIMGNLIAAAAGFALASQGHMDYKLFLATMMAIALVIASACVFNNYLDRHADQKMARTKNRPLAKGLISLKNATIFAIILGLISIVMLTYYTNLTSIIVAIAGFTIYVCWYSIWKYRTVHGTLIGSLAGAVPPMVGYCAVTNRIDMGTALLFVILVFWQMPHFYAISIYRMKEYADASIPVLPIKKGIPQTKVQMLLYIVGFMIVSLMPTFLGYTGAIYLIVTLVAGLAWLALSIQGFKAKNDTLWAHKMFRISLIVITALCAAMALDVTVL